MREIKKREREGWTWRGWGWREAQKRPPRRSRPEPEDRLPDPGRYFSFLLIGVNENETQG